MAGADSIDDLEVIRHGALPGLFGGIRAPSTLGTFLRGFTWGNVRQLDAVARETLTGLSRNAPLLPGADSYAFLDVDSTITVCMGMPNRARTGDTLGYGGCIHCWRRSRHRSPHRSSPVPAYVGARRPQPRARPASSPRPSPPHVRLGPPASCRPGWTRRSTTTPWWPPASGPGSASRSPRDRAARSGRDPGHRPGRLGSDRLPARDLRRGQRAVDLRRPDRRDHLHRLSLAAQIRADYPPVDRPASEEKKSPPRASCSPPGITTRLSPTRPWNSWPPRNNTANMRSSNRSTQTSKTQPWRTCSRDHLPRTRPG